LGWLTHSLKKQQIPLWQTREDGESCSGGRVSKYGSIPAQLDKSSVTRKHFVDMHLPGFTRISDSQSHHCLTGFYRIRAAYAAVAYEVHTKKNGVIPKGEQSGKERKEGRWKGN